MRILFVCGCLEPGRDGVGDYTRVLAKALIQRGIDVRLLAIRDSFIFECTFEKQAYLGNQIEVYRVPLSVGIRKGFIWAEKNLIQFDPSWISLQFVPYAFSSLGTPWQLPKAFASFFESVSKHILLHETHNGGNLGLKNELVRIAQIYILKRLTTTPRAEVVHTTNSYYQQRLKRIGISSSLLGLFGNIPISIDLPQKRAIPHQALQGVYFGVSPREGDFVRIAQNFAKFLDKSNFNIKIIFCGKSGQDRQQFADVLKSYCPPGRLTIQQLGFMDSKELSELLLASDFGVARAEPALMGKSGTAIAMLEHGLPLYVPLAENQKQIDTDFDFRTDLCFSNLLDLAGLTFRPPPKSRIEAVVKKMLSDMEDSKLDKRRNQF